MIRNSLIGLLILGLGIFMISFFVNYQSPTSLNKTASYYLSENVAEVGAANVVTSIVVTYRGLDTLGEVTVLFLTALIIGFMLKKKGEVTKKQKPESSEILATASKILVPGSIILGVYIFVNGHLTPGGGFQGGAVIGSAIMLLMLSDPKKMMSKTLLHWIEGVSGFAYVILGLLGLFFAGGFLDNRLLPLGELGTLFSAGIIPIIYSLIGLKVGAEISNIISNINETELNND